MLPFFANTSLLEADISPLRPNFQNYLTCGDTANDIEFFGLNAYEWCGNNSYGGSGYSALNAQVQNFPVPIFFSETGCIVPEPRLFQDQNAIFGSEMGGTWSGAIIYEWIQEDNHYGLITYGGGNTNAFNSAAPAGGFSRSGTPTPITPDFSNLKSVWATLTPSGVREAVYSPSITPPPCPAETPGIWNINGNAPIPPVGQAAVQTSHGAGISSIPLKSTPVTPPIIVIPHSAYNPSSLSSSLISALLQALLYSFLTFLHSCQLLSLLFLQVILLRQLQLQVLGRALALLLARLMARLLLLQQVPAVLKVQLQEERRLQACHWDWQVFC